MRKKRRLNKNKKYLSPIVVIFIITIIVIVVSAIFSLLEIEASVTEVKNNALETSLVTMNNILTSDGIKVFLSNIIENFANFKVLFYLIISLMGIGILEKSGLIGSIMRPFKGIKNSISTFFILVLSILAASLGDAGYCIIIPLSALIYKYLNRNPMLGIITSFLGLSVCYGTSFIYNNNDLIIGNLMQSAARVEVDKNFTFELYSNIFINISTVLIFLILGTLIIERFLAPKFSRKNKSELEQTISNKRATFFTLITFVVCLIFIVYSIIPGYPLSGLLLDNEANSYIEKVWGNSAPFKDAIIFIISLLFIIVGSVYGIISKTIKNSQEFSDSLTFGLKGIEKILVLIFMVSQLVGIIEWTNLDQVIAGNLIDFLSVLEFSGLPLIFLFFFLVFIIGIAIPSVINKWNITAPLIIPLFMRSNIAPEFTTFVFKAADGISKCFTPINSGFIIMLGFLNKYNQEDDSVTLFGTFNKLRSTILLLLLVWLLIITGWYLIGLPLGNGVYPTL